MNPEVQEGEAKSLAGLRVWINEWYDLALAAGFVRPPLRVDDVIVAQLVGYFSAGLTVVECIEAIFGVMP